MTNKIIIVDDDPLVGESLRDLVTAHMPGAQIDAVCMSGEAGIHAIRQHEPDLVFLDVMMPGMNGFEMLHLLDGYRFDVVFVTAYDQYAIEAIRHSALDYLLKPIKKDEFVKAVQRFSSKRASEENIGRKIESLEQNLAEKEITGQKLVIHSLKGTEIIPVTDIVYCTSESNYTEFHLRNGRKLLASKTLGFFEEELKESGLFIRIHRSTLLNREHIAKILPTGIAVLHSGQQLEVSQRRLAEVRRGI
ncbi:MAG: response regulator transcription factor [Flavobacteriales bacterium]|nr:response regulator transcription factor [Flavobacteriales bacterium]